MRTSTRRTSTEKPSSRDRRGVALVFVLVFVVGMAALAMSSIFLASNANLLAKSYDKERDLKYAAEMGLQIGKSRVNQDPSILVMQPNQVDTTILSNATMNDASGAPMTGVTVSVYVGPTGSTSGQFGRFSSIVSVATDARKNAFIRRLELTQESFAKFAYWSNQENAAGASTIFFNNGDALWGPVWSNDTINIGSGGATFHDDVGTVWVVNGANYGVFSKGYKQYQKPIQLPSTAVLLTLKTISASSGWDFTSTPANNTEGSLTTRIEFLAADLNTTTGDSTDLDEGAFRLFVGNTNAATRGDWPGGTTVANFDFCGDWHSVRVGGVAGTLTPQFFPASVHSSAWFKTMDSTALRDGGSTANSANTTAGNEQAASLQTIMGHANARCYLAGDPHLAPVERNAAIAIDPKTGNKYTTVASSWQKGGMDTTFTPVGKYGTWQTNPAAMAARWLAARGDKSAASNTPVGANIGDAKYLFPIDRLYNANAKGVIHFSGNVGISGTLNGRVTLYSNGTIVLLDDLRYANDPVKGVCRDILGIIADKDIVIADNALLKPQDPGSGDQNMDETKDLDIHAVMMALGNSFRVENYNVGPTAVNNCGTVTNGRGCINLSGGLIQNIRGAVGQSNGNGFSKRYSYDHCAVVNPPPYFPTTGRFQDNRYLELDPAGFNHRNYFLSIVP